MKSISDKEKEQLDFWEENKIFERSVAERPKDRPFTFYDGPPFATGLPHYGHIIASLMKDVVPRYWTMKGYRVERVWGWDCHGLPIENIIEEKLKLKTKKDIESYGVANFNEQCRATVLEYAQDWKKTIRRMGRWVDMDHAYMTMSPSYMESVWWVFAELWKQGLIVEGKKAMHVCPRCATPLSNFEVTLGYKDVSDITATVKIHLKPDQEFGGGKYKTKDTAYILAWTTTPWTLPGNVALAVGKDIKYTSLRIVGIQELLIVASDRVSTLFKDKEVEIVHDDMTGADLVGLVYEPLFPYFKDTQNAFRVVSADFVSTHEGTGVVHIAPAFGEDDYELGKREDIGFVQHVTQEGVFTEDVTDFAGKQVKPKEDSSRTDAEIVDWLGKNNKLFSKETYLHSYPHCWRCDTPLLNYATSSWFIRVTELKKELLANNAKTTWIPEHMRDGRFGMWLENARDWAVSRNRYWGTPLPIWKSEDGDVVCIGSIAELEDLSGKKITDLHKHTIDSVTFEKNDKTYRRIEGVLDCWFESGAMPYAQLHYPFENKEKFEQGFPAQFIAEGQDQTRGWFYTLHVLASILTRGENPSIRVADGCVPAFLNVIVNGIVLAADGKKMSKRLKNYPDPLEVMERYGADAMRYYLVSSPAMYAENLNFNEQSVKEVYNKIVNTLENVLAFYRLFETTQKKEGSISNNVLDVWIVSRLNRLNQTITKEMDAYRLAYAARPFIDFASDLSQWYVRRSRDRFKSEDIQERNDACSTLGHVLETLAKLLAPFAPFLAERIYTIVGEELSVHLVNWPEYQEKYINNEIEESMDKVKNIVELGHSLRSEANIKVRQPLAEFHCNQEFSSDYYSIIADELNVKSASYCSLFHGGEWKQKKEGELEVHMCFSMNQELKEEGLIRELTRLINAKRKQLSLTVADIISVRYTTDNKELQMSITHLHDSFARAILAHSIEEGSGDDMEEMSVDGVSINIAIQKVV